MLHLQFFNGRHIYSSHYFENFDLDIHIKYILSKKNIVSLFCITDAEYMMQNTDANTDATVSLFMVKRIFLNVEWVLNSWRCVCTRYFESRLLKHVSHSKRKFSIPFPMGFAIYFQPEKWTAHEKELCQQSCDVIQNGGAYSIVVYFSLRVILFMSARAIRRTREEIDRAYLDPGGGGKGVLPLYSSSRYVRPKAYGLSAVFGHRISILPSLVTKMFKILHSSLGFGFFYKEAIFLTLSIRPATKAFYRLCLLNGLN